MTVQIKRSVQIKVTLTPELHQRLRALSEQLGQAPASVASLAIGQFVAMQERNLGAGQAMVQAIAEKVGPESVNMLRQLMQADEPAEPKGLVTSYVPPGPGLIAGAMRQQNLLAGASAPADPPKIKNALLEGLEKGKKAK